MTKDDLVKLERKTIATLALFGLTEALLDPPCRKVFLEAHRIIFDVESVELKKIAALLKIDTAVLQKNTFSYLTRAGFSCDPAVKH